MADLLPQNFPTPSESAITSYPYQDIAEGTGTVEYYGIRVAVDNTPANDDYFLITSGIPSSVEQTQMSVNDEIYFDVVFNAPKIVEGNCFVIVPVHLNGNNTSMTNQVGIDKVSDSTTSLLAYTTLEAESHTGDTNSYHTMTLRAEISKTNFKIGDILRLKIKNSAGSGGDGFLYHEPTASDSNFTLTGGRLSFLVPFRINI